MGFSWVGRWGLEAAWVCLLSLDAQGREGMRQQVVVGRPREVKEFLGFFLPHLFSLVGG